MDGYAMDYELLSVDAIYGCVRFNVMSDVDFLVVGDVSGTKPNKMTVFDCMLDALETDCGLIINAICPLALL